MPILCSGRGSKTLNKLDTLNYTNIQCKASIRSEWTENPLFSVLLLSEVTLLMQFAYPEHWRMGESATVTLTVIYQKYEKQIHITFAVLNTRHKFQVSIQSIYALKNYFRFTQMTLEGRFVVNLSVQFDHISLDP